MSDVNTKLESSQIVQAQDAQPNFDAEILPNLQQTGKGAQADTKALQQDAAKGATSEQPKDLDFSPIQTSGWPESGQVRESDSAQTDNTDIFQINRPELHPQRQEMVDAAEKAVGTQPWKSHERADITQGGALAGGFNISAIVRAAGYSDVDAAYIRGTGGVEDQLTKNHGWIKNDVSQAKPGDIYIVPSPGGGSATTVGIVGKDGSLYSHSRDGSVIKFNRPLRSNGYVLSPPETNE